jgi:Rieske Fe-S protein
MSVHDGVATPRMRRQLRLLAMLAGFVVLVVAVAFVAAFRNTATDDLPSTLVRIDASSVREGDVVKASAATDVVVAGTEYRGVDFFVVRSDGAVHALWARSPHLGCRVKPIGEVDIPHGDNAGFADPCGGSLFALDGRCIDGPCPRGLDGFAIVERNGVAYADLARPVRGQPR